MISTAFISYVLIMCICVTKANFELNKLNRIKNSAGLKGVKINSDDPNVPQDIKSQVRNLLKWTYISVFLGVLGITILIFLK